MPSDRLVCGLVCRINIDIYIRRVNEETEIYPSLDIKGITHRYIIIILMLRADKTIYTETIKKIDIKSIKEKKSCQRS